MFLSCYSEVLTIQEVIAAAKDGKSSEAHFVLLTHIAHIEELLVVEDEQLPLPVEVRGQCDRGEGPPDELFEHVHATHARDQAKCRRVSPRSHVDVVAVLAFGHIHPVFLHRGPIVVNATVEHVLREEAHAKVDSCLVLGRNPPMLLVQAVEVVLSYGICLASYDQRHSFSFWLIIIN